MASQKFSYYQHQQVKQEKPWMRHNHSPVAVNPERVTTLLELATEHYGKQCARCGSKKALTVHHRHYRHIGFEKPVDDVVLLCSACHQDLHKRSKTKGLNRDDIPFVDPNWADSLQGIAPRNEAKYRGRLEGVDDSLIRTWKVVYRDRDGQEWVSVDYHVTKEDALKDSAYELRYFDFVEIVSIEDVTGGLQTVCGFTLMPLEPHQKSLQSHQKYDRC